MKAAIFALILTLAFSSNLVIPKIKYFVPPDGGHELIDEICWSSINTIKSAWFFENFHANTGRTDNFFDDTYSGEILTLCK